MFSCSRRQTFSSEEGSSRGEGGAGSGSRSDEESRSLIENSKSELKKEKWRLISLEALVAVAFNPQMGWKRLRR